VVETVLDEPEQETPTPWYRQRTWQVCTVLLVALAVLIGYYMLERSRGNALPETVAPLQPPHQVVDDGPVGITVANTSPNEPDAPVVLVYQDYQDQMSGEVELTLSDAINALASRGEIILEYRTMTFLDRGQVDGSSQRAAVAAACADLQGVYAAYHHQVFAGQNGAGFTENELRSEFAIAVGLQGTDLAAFQACFDNRRTEAFVVAVAARALADGVSATPTYIVNGVPFDLTTLQVTDGRVSETSLRAAIRALTAPDEDTEGTVDE
jgi:protein-disulfide isomerase